MPTFGVVVFSLRGMKHLPDCLKSVAQTLKPDEILLLHAGGGAPEIGGGEFPALRIQSVGSLAEAKKYFAEIKAERVLFLWADERLEGGLADELRELCRDRSPGRPPSCRIPVRSYVLREWVEGSVCGPSPAVRFGRNLSEVPLGWWAQKDRTASEPTRGWIGDYGCSDLSDAVERVQSLSEFWAESLGCAASPPGPARTALRSLGVFIKMLFLNRLVSRGIAGITLSALASYAVLLGGVKLWEARHARK